MLKEPIRLTLITLSKSPSAIGPSLPITRLATPIPAQFTSTRAGPWAAAALAIAASAEAASETSQITATPPISAATEAVSGFGADGALPLMHEWRGALFRVRLARLRLVPPQRHASQAIALDSEGLARPLAAFLLALGGALAFVAGATLGLWPLWAIGMAAVCCSVLVYRP